MQRFKELLGEAGVDFNKLVICMLGGAECIIGETDDRGTNFGRYDVGTPGFAGCSFVIKNPKRVMRRQEQKGTTATIIFYIADLDLISGGVMEVHPVAASMVKWLNIDSQISYAGLYLIHIEQEKEARMERANLVKPVISLPPNLRQPHLR